MVTFGNGDADLVYHKKSGIYEVYITRCGESGREKFKSLSELAKVLVDVYFFDDSLVLELVKTSETAED